MPKIITKPQNPKYSEAWERIFGYASDDKRVLGPDNLKDGKIVIETVKYPVELVEDFKPDNNYWDEQKKIAAKEANEEFIKRALEEFIKRALLSQPTIGESL